jgi:hypothetical protein
MVGRICTDGWLIIVARNKLQHKMEETENPVKSRLKI